MLNDIYYQKEYVSLYLNGEDELFEFKYEINDFIFYQIAIKRPILKIGDIFTNEKFFDLESAYGYGGIYCNTDNNTFINDALTKYKKKCTDEKIIAEFSSIHPFNNSKTKLNEYYNFLALDRKTAIIDTTLTKDERWNKYASKTRTILRKCGRELTFEKSDDINQFLKLYNQTMDKNNADDFYYFNEEYFKRLLSIKNVELYVVKHNELTISASFFMFGDKIGHYHLSANNNDYRKFNGNYYILDSIFDISNKKGISSFHLGGGRTNLEDDLLFKFKQKFSTNILDFFIGGKIHNTEKYNEYIKIWEDQNEVSPKYFLKYRL